MLVLVWDGLWTLAQCHWVYSQDITFRERRTAYELCQLFGKQPALQSSMQVEKAMQFIHFELATQCNTFAFTADSCPLDGSEIATLPSPSAKAAAKAELCAIDDVCSLASNPCSTCVWLRFEL